jgi:uncharacterized protein (DUF362 family)/Pyruvate/2-oxoacid:ferredoxin oxidoreductase delta subunit
MFRLFNSIEWSDPDRSRVRVAIADATYQAVDSSVRKLIEALDLQSWLHKLKDKKVFIKPNLLGAFPAEKHVTTSPELVRSVVRLIQEFGAQVMVGDNCGVGGYGLNQSVAKNSGILEASQGAYKNVAQNTVSVKIDSRYVTSVVVSRDMLEADVLISLPVMKTHSLTVVTGGVKNMFGIVAGGGKGRLHAAAPSAEDFGRMLAQIYAIRPPDLTIMDAVTAMEGYGPSAGKPKWVGKILASENAVALDAVVCRIMGVEPAQVHHVREASAMGYGRIDAASIEIIGELPRNIQFKLPLEANRMKFVPVVSSYFFGTLARSKLKLNAKKCKKCKLCVEGCPTGAMIMKELPWIDQQKCIRCLCCHELCPENAWEMKGLMRRLQGHGV